MVRRMADQLPAEFLDGITDITVTGKTVPHPVWAGVWTLGECIPHLTGGPDDAGSAIRSRIELHYGSFRALAGESPGFDWRGEAWETLTHEVRHHLEWRARAGALEAYDAAADANYARHGGEPFPPLFYRGGEEVSPGVFKVEDDVFVEKVLSRREWKRAGGTVVSFGWHGRSCQVALPQQLSDIVFVTVTGAEPEPAGDLVLVVRRRPGLTDVVSRAAVLCTSAEASCSAPPRR